MEFLQENWILISGVLLVMIQMIQLMTKHFSNYSWVTKAGLVLTEGLSFFTSKDVEDLVFKLPGTSKPPNK